MLYIHKNHNPNWHLYYDLRKEPETKTLCREQLPTESFSFRKSYSECPGRKMSAQSMNHMT